MVAAAGWQKVICAHAVPCVPSRGRSNRLSAVESVLGRQAARRGTVQGAAKKGQHDAFRVLYDGPHQSTAEGRFAQNAAAGRTRIGSQGRDQEHGPQIKDRGAACPEIAVSGPDSGRKCELGEIGRSERDGALSLGDTSTADTPVALGRHNADAGPIPCSPPMPHGAVRDSLY